MTDILSTAIPAVIFIGGAAVLYTQCIKGKSTTSTPLASKKSDKSQQQSGGKSNTKKSNADDESYEPEDFLSPKQLKELKEKEKRAAEQQLLAEKVKAKKQKEEERRQRAAEAARNAPPTVPTVPTPTTSPTNNKKNKQQEQPKKLFAAEQLALAAKKKGEKEQRKKEEKQKQKEIEEQVAKKLQKQEQQLNKKAEKAKEDKALLEAFDDPEWKPVMTKKQRQRQRELMYASSDDSDVEDLSSGSTIIETITDDSNQNQATAVVVEKVKVMVPIPEKQRHLIIGKGGETIEAIKTKTACWISVPKDEDIKKDFARLYNQGPIYISVEGSREGALRAKKIILELAEKGFSPTLTGGLIESKFHVVPEKRAAIIGPKGAYREALQKTLEVKIVMPDRLSRDTTVTIGGQREQVNACKKALQQLVDQGFSSITHPTWIKHTMEFQASYRRRLIGRAGQTIKQLQSNTRCKISFPSSETKNTVNIIGDEANIPLAVKAIHKLVEQIEFDEEASAVAALRAESDDEELDEDLAQYLYIPDEEEEY